MIDRLGASSAPLTSHVWEEPLTCVVLGKGNKEDQELHFQAIHEQAIPVFRREGGGGSVVLGPGMLIISVAAHVTDPFGSKRFFELIQTPIQEALTRVGVPGVVQRGISDLAWQGRKILGSSMRRKGSLLLYQAVLLVDVDRAIFKELLQHPPKEPDYREGRDHDSFTVSLREIGYKGSLTELQEALLYQLQERLPALLQDDLKHP